MSGPIRSTRSRLVFACSVGVFSIALLSAPLAHAQEANLGVTIAPDVPEGRVGQPTPLTITVTNAGPSDVDEVRVSAGPGGSILTTSQGTCSGTRCRVGPIAAGGSATVAMSYLAQSAGPRGVFAEVGVAYANRRTVPDPDLANNKAWATFNVQAAGPCEIFRRGTPGPDRISGTASGGDRILGLAGADVLMGYGGADCLAGDVGADRLYGGTGNDVLEGGPDDDRLYGEAGADRLSGGAGDDLLVGGAGINRYSAGAGDDTVSARNGRRERINCGNGRDRVRGDKADRVTSCERRY